MKSHRILIENERIYLHKQREITAMYTGGYEPQTPEADGGEALTIQTRWPLCFVSRI